MELRWGRVGFLASVIFPIFEHVHDITDLAKPIRHATGAYGALAPHKIMNIDDERSAPKLAPTPLVDCEAVASQIADPTLSRSIGRCFV
jgi:hypothetical protein